MKSYIVRMVNALLGVLKLRLVQAQGNEDIELMFHSWHYLRHNTRRLEHLASLNIPVRGKTVLELGAGIGDHSSYFIDRDCEITITESRPENVEYIKRRYPGVDSYVLDLEDENFSRRVGRKYDVIHCYGLLYHLSNPARVIQQMASCCSGLLLLETAVSFGEDSRNYTIREDRTNPSQAMSGIGSRPTRVWLYNELEKHFEFVYIPVTQPNHEEFPVDWSAEKGEAREARSVFICSRSGLDNNAMLTPELSKIQKRQT